MLLRAYDLSSCNESQDYILPPYLPSRFFASWLIFQNLVTDYGAIEYSRTCKKPILFWMKHDETDLSSFENSPQTEIRVPRPHENDQWSQADQSAPPVRTQEPLRLRKRDKLLKRYEFRRLAREGKRLVGTNICIDWAYAPTLRLGITASARYGSAPERSRFKRLVREAFRLSKKDLPQGIEINISPRKLAKKASFADIHSELCYLLDS